MHARPGAVGLRGPPPIGGKVVWMALPERGTAHADGRHNGALVVIAEDEPAIAAVLAMVVEEAGYVPLLARNGAQALALVRERRPALLITDLMMPVLDGAALIAALRDTDILLPAIIVTALPRQAQGAGADAVLGKPFDVSQLEGLLARFLPL